MIGMRIWVGVTLLVLSTVITSSAQLNRGAITGTISDQSGGIIVGVRVSVKNSATGAVYHTESNEAGQYSARNLPSGSYEISFKVTGFRELVRTGVGLGTTEVLRVDATLEVGSDSEFITVNAEVPRLQSETSEVATSLSGKDLLSLPLSFSGGGRKAENFAYKIAQGVAGDGWTSYINGGIAFSKESLIDGASATTWDSGDITASSPSVEALHEVKVQTTGISAEFGRTQSGVFNLTMKSGGNKFHGSAFGALRNEALNANSFANNFRGVKRPLDRKQDFAGSLGGPIVSNKTFFYVAYERYRERNYGFGAPDRTAPIPEFYDGDFSRLLGASTGFTDALGRDVLRGAIYDPATFRQLPNGQWVGDPFEGNRIPVARFSSVARRLNEIAKKSYLPTVRDASGRFALVNNARYPVSQAMEWDNHQFSVKGDHILNESHKLSGSYTHVAQVRGLLAIGGLWDATDKLGGPLSWAWGQPVKTNLVRLAHDWTVSSTMLNHFTLFFNRQRGVTSNVHQNTDGAKELGIQNLSTIGFPMINWGSGPFVGLAPVGEATKGGSADNSWGVVETFSFSKARHFMKAGFDMRRNHYNVFSTQNGAFNFNARGTAIPNQAFSGNLTGYSFASYLLGIVDSASLADPISLGGRRFAYAAFMHDDFKVGPNLTLQLGVRWDFTPPPFEAADRYSSWNPGKTDPASGLRGAYDFAGNCQICTGERYFGVRDYKGFAPRVGFAYQFRQKWSVRGAYGIFYEGDVFNGFAATPLGKSTSLQWGGTWQLAPAAVDPWKGIFNWDSGFPVDRFVPPVFDVSWGNRNGPGMIHPEYGKAPYSQQWNLNLQRQLLGNLILDIGYLGNKGTRLRNGGLMRLNQLPPALLTQYGRNLTNPVRSEAEAAANGIRYPFPGFTGTVASALRPYPQVQGNQTVGVYGAPLGFSTYHSLQVTVNKQFSNSLTAYGNYVWSKSIANTESALGNPGPRDYYNLSLEKAVSAQDIPHMLKAYVDYRLPFGKDRALASNASSWVNAIIGGWSVSTILNYFSGRPLVFSASSPLPGGWNGAALRPNIGEGALVNSGFVKDSFNLAAVSSPSNAYLRKTVFADPAPLTLGAAAPRYAQARGFGTINEDLGLQKSHSLSERFKLQLRVEFLNVFNRHQLGGIVTNVADPLFGQVTTVTGNREVQIGARLDF